ncbi:hypothetical protein GCM10023162_24910 [Klenkia terrae]
MSLARQVATVVARTTWDDVPAPVLDRSLTRPSCPTRGWHPRACRRPTGAM